MGMECEVRLADYFGWFLKARNGAIYRAEGDSFCRLASFGTNKLTLAGLPADELVVPILINEDLWGLFAVGPRVSGEYDGSEGLYLSLFGLNLISCLERRRQGMLPRTEAQAKQEYRALQQTEQMWASLRPRNRSLKLCIRDPEPDAASALHRFFRGWGFDTSTATVEGEADLFLTVLPDAILLETAFSGNRQRLPKPCRFPLLARCLFEAALSVALAPASPIVKNCLIVDDEVEATQALEEYFRLKGCRVSTARTGERALKLVAQHRPDLVFLDMKLPGVSGEEAIREIRRISPNSRIVVLTAWMAEYPEAVLEGLRPDAYRFKPVPLEELNELLYA